MVVRRKKYTKEEIHDAGIKVMRSLNKINKRGAHSLQKKVPGLSSLPAVVSKSAKKRQHKKLNENLAGATLASLAETLPDTSIPEPETRPRISHQKQRQQLIANETKKQNQILTTGLNTASLKDSIRQRLARGDI